MALNINRATVVRKKTLPKFPYHGNRKPILLPYSYCVLIVFLLTFYCVTVDFYNKMSLSKLYYDIRILEYISDENS